MPEPLANQPAPPSPAVAAAPPTATAAPAAALDEAPKPPIDNPVQDLEEARDKVKDAFNAKRTKMKTEQGSYAENVVQDILIDPINAIGHKWAEARKKFLDSADKETELLMLRSEYKATLDAQVKMVENYINEIAGKHGGWLDANALAEMTSNINKNAALYAKLLTHADPALFKAIQVVMGETVDGKAHQEEMAKALPVLANMAAQEISKGTSGLMPCLWTLVGFLKRPDRIQFGKIYAQGKSEREVDEFLRVGNVQGVFSADEMQLIMADFKKQPDFQYADKDNLTQTWQRANDVRKRANVLMKGSYGSTNAAEGMMNFKNLLLGIGQVAAATTVGANLAFGMWKGGALRSVDGLVKTVTNPTMWAGVAVYKGIDIARDSKPLGQVLEGVETVDENKRQEAYQLLNKERKGNPLFDSWESFFAGPKQDFSGAQVFYEFLLDSKKKVDSDVLPEDAMTTTNFLTYLKEQSESKDPDRKGVDYKALYEEFSNLRAPSILAFAKSFDTLKIGGTNARESYLDAIEQTKTL